MKKKYLYCVTLLAVLTLSACSTQTKNTTNDPSATTTTTPSEVTTDEKDTNNAEKSITLNTEEFIHKYQMLLDIQNGKKNLVIAKMEQDQITVYANKENKLTNEQKQDIADELLYFRDQTIEVYFSEYSDKVPQLIFKLDDGTIIAEENDEHKMEINK